MLLLVASFYRFLLPSSVAEKTLCNHFYNFYDGSEICKLLVQTYIYFT